MSMLLIIIPLIVCFLAIWIVFYLLIKRRDKANAAAARLPNSPVSEQFESLLKVLNIILTITLASLAAAFVVLCAVMIWLFTLSSEQFKQLFLNGTINFALDSGGVSYSLSQKLLEMAHPNPHDAAYFILMTLISIVLSFIITLLGKRLVQAFRRNEIFTVQNGKTIQTISLFIGFMSVASITIDSIISMLIDRMTGFGALMKSEGWISSVNYSVTGINWNLFLAAFLVWIIGRAFIYGAFLQDEYDSTI